LHFVNVRKLPTAQDHSRRDEKDGI